MNIKIKKLLLYSITPALIAGAFSIAPKLYDILTAPRAELTYERTMGPSLTSGSQHEQIALVTVKNTGTRSLTNVMSLITPQQGKIEAFQLNKDSALNTSSEITTNGILTKAPTLLPGEQFSVSLMLNSSPSEQTALIVVARSEQVLGSAAHLNPIDKSQASEYLGSALAALSVFVMSLAFIVRKTIRPMISHNKEDALYYLFTKLDLAETSNRLQLNSDTTYLRSADFLLSYGLKSNDKERQKSINGLKCLLLISNIATTSEEIIMRNIKMLEGTGFSENEIASLKSIATPVSEPMRLRENIDQFLAAPTKFIRV